MPRVELNDDEVNFIEEKLNKFVKKVDSGKARSVETYKDVKDILAILQTKKQEANPDAKIPRNVGRTQRK